MTDSANRETLVRTKLLDTLAAIIRGDLVLTDGGTIRSSSGGNIEINPDGGGVVNITNIGTLKNLSGSMNLANAVHGTRGQRSVGWVDLGGAVVAAEYITIGGLIFEFNTVPVAPGRVLVDVTPGLTAALVMPVLVAAVNAHPECGAVAYDAGQDTMMLVSIDNTPFTLTKHVALYTVSGATSTGEQAPAPRNLISGNYTITAEDAAVLGDANGTIIIGAYLTSAIPTVLVANAKTALGVPVPLLTTQILVVELALATPISVIIVTDTAGTPDLSATDVISFIGVN